MYKFFRPLLFILPPEIAHALALNLLKLATVLKLTTFFTTKTTAAPIELFGLTFRNRIGIAAGLDKNGDYLGALAALGVGFIEVGAVTPKPQIGNPKPRLFRLIKEQALINRMGFNNKGVDYLVRNLQRYQKQIITTQCIVGVNLGKNKETLLAHAAQDYVDCLKKIFPYADFATINISSPNTPELCKLQTPEYVENLLCSIKQVRDSLVMEHQKKLPLLVKIAPDLSDEELFGLVDAITKVALDGIIAVNTSNQRPQVNHNPLATQTGGLSGKPIVDLSYDILVKIRQRDPNIPIISLGGINSIAEGQRRFQAGANLVQVYTGFIYEGPRLLKRLIHRT